MHVTKELSASLDYFRLMFVFSPAGGLAGSLLESGPKPIPFVVFVW
jgi:hypothetical protein